MFRPKEWLSTCFLTALACVSICRVSPAQEYESAAQFFPTTTALYLEIPRPDQLLEKIETHPVTQKVGDLKQVKRAIRSPQFAMGLLVKGLVEAQIEEPLLDAIKNNIAGGLSVGVDTKTNGLALVFQSTDEASLRRLAGTILNVVSTGAKQQGNDPPFKRQEYREAVAAEFDDFIVARYKSWFVVSNKNKLAKILVDNMIDESSTSLVDQSWFQEAQVERSADAWMAIDLETIRSTGVARELFQGRTDNPGAELILGGLFDAFKNAQTASGDLRLDKDLSLTFSIPFNREWATEAREFFFGKDFAGSAPTPLVPENQIASLISYRDIAGWWLSKEDLFEENVIAQLAQADSQLSTIFSGMDFGQDVLGSLEPGVQIVAAENTFDEQYVPDVKLPAFALIGKLKEPDKIRRKLKIAFQSVIGFANINLGMQGQPQLDLETESIGEAKISAAQYYYDEDTEDGLLLFNFSPTIAFQGPYLIVSSTRDLAVELAQLATVKPNSIRQSKTDRSNTKLDFDLEVLGKVLTDNRESLIAQNMLEEGNSRKQAEEAISLLLEVIDLLDESSVDFQVEDDKMQVDILLTTK